MEYTQENPLRLIELFAGIGSQTQALKNIGVPHKVVAISEIDKNALTSYKALHGETLNLGDIRRIEELPEADFWTYSFPCQDISVAGHGAGIKNIGYIRTNYADDFHGVQSQAAGKGIGLVPHVLHDFQNPGPGLFADAAAAVEHPRYCSDRHAALLGNIVNSYIHERIIPLVLLVKSRRRSLCRGALPYYSIKMAMG